MAYDIIKIIRDEVNKRFSSAVNMLRKGVLTLVSDSYFAQWEAADGELYDESEFWQSFGFASRPPAGGEVLFANLGGHGEHAIGFASNDRAHRPASLAYGDSVHYASASGGSQARAHAKASGHYDIVPGSSQTVNIGGDSTACADYLLKGTTFNTALRTAIGSSGIAPPGTATGIVKYIYDLKTDPYLVMTLSTTNALQAIIDYLDALAAGSYLATKGKVL